MPEDPMSQLHHYAKVRLYHPGDKFEGPYTDDDGYRWVPFQYTFRERDDEKSNDKTFVAKRELSFVCYKIDLTEEQRQSLEEFCSCPYHTKNPEKQRKDVCTCCVGCLYTDFAQQGNIVEAIKLKKAASILNKV